jgi:hypothetical protein
MTDEDEALGEAFVVTLEAIEAALREQIPEQFLLDPPDGGDVPVIEGIQRMAVAIARLTRERDEVLLARDKAIQALGEEARLRGRTETERDVARSERDEARAAALEEAARVADEWLDAFLNNKFGASIRGPSVRIRALAPREGGRG